MLTGRSGSADQAQNDVSVPVDASNMLWSEAWPNQPRWQNKWLIKNLFEKCFLQVFRSILPFKLSIRKTVSYDLHGILLHFKSLATFWTDNVSDMSRRLGDLSFEFGEQIECFLFLWPCDVYSVDSWWLDADICWTRDGCLNQGCRVLAWRLDLLIWLVKNTPMIRTCKDLYTVNARSDWIVLTESEWKAPQMLFLGCFNANLGWPR